jgi:hypothetical protein
MTNIAGDSCVSREQEQLENLCFLALLLVAKVYGGCPVLLRAVNMLLHHFFPYLILNLLLLIFQSVGREG